MVTLCKSRQCFCDAYRSTPTSVYIVVVGFVARLLATVEGEGRWVSDVGVRHECWPSNTAEKIALISEIYFLPWASLSLPFCLSLSLLLLHYLLLFFSLCLTLSSLSFKIPRRDLSVKFKLTFRNISQIRRGHT